MSKLELLPAVDVQGGQAVQLTQGVAGSEKVFGDPLVAAQRWQDGGAEWIHLVDLDAAFGRGSNAEVIAAIVAQLQIKVELSGGDVYKRQPVTPRITTPCCAFRRAPTRTRPAGSSSTATAIT